MKKFSTFELLTPFINLFSNEEVLAVSCKDDSRATVCTGFGISPDRYGSFMQFKCMECGKEEMKILDPACGSKMFWFNKSEPHTTYTDIRKETFSLQDRGKLRKVVINPDKIADFTNLPFRDYEFNLIVFDPPHLKRAGENSWLTKKYGKLPKDVWPQMLSKGFKELWRVLALDGILLFKWSDNQIPFKDVLNLFDQQPILGDQRGHTRWFVFIKPNDNQTSEPSLLSESDLKERGLEQWRKK